MMYYAIFCEDTENSFEKRRAVRPAHLKRLSELDAEGRLLLAGPLMGGDDKNAAVSGIIGSLIVAAFDDLESAKVWAAADPYVTADVYARVRVEPFKKVFPE